MGKFKEDVIRRNGQVETPDGAAGPGLRRGTGFFGSRFGLSLETLSSCALKPFNPFAQFANRLPPGPEHAL